jgi:hypothetical protein
MAGLYAVLKGPAHRLQCSLTILGEVGFPPRAGRGRRTKDQRRPRARAVTGMVLVGAQRPLDRCLGGVRSLPSRLDDGTHRPHRSDFAHTSMIAGT